MAIPAPAVHAIQWVAFHYRRLDREAQTALTVHGDLDLFHRKLQAAGLLIAALPEVARNLLDDSAESVHVLDVLETMADEVRRYLEHEQTYLNIGNFLIPHGSSVHDPNHLELLIAAHAVDEY